MSSHTFSPLSRLHLSQKPSTAVRAPEQGSKPIPRPPRALLQAPSHLTCLQPSQQTKDWGGRQRPEGEPLPLPVPPNPGYELPSAPAKPNTVTPSPGAALTPAVSALPLWGDASPRTTVPRLPPPAKTSPAACETLTKRLRSCRAPLGRDVGKHFSYFYGEKRRRKEKLKVLDTSWRIFYLSPSPLFSSPAARKGGVPADRALPCRGRGRTDARTDRQTDPAREPPTKAKPVPGAWRLAPAVVGVGFHGGAAPAPVKNPRLGGEGTLLLTGAKMAAAASELLTGWCLFGLALLVRGGSAPGAHPCPSLLSFPSVGPAGSPPSPPLAGAGCSFPLGSPSLFQLSVPAWPPPSEACASPPRQPALPRSSRPVPRRRCRAGQSPGPRARGCLASLAVSFRPFRVWALLLSSPRLLLPRGQRARWG